MRKQWIGLVLFLLAGWPGDWVWAQTNPSQQAPIQQPDPAQQPAQDPMVQPDAQPGIPQDPAAVQNPPVQPDPNAPAPQPTVTNSMIENPEPLYVQFKRILPLKPGSLNLFGYETARIARGIPVLSPDKRWMIGTEVYYMPMQRQTYSRVSLYPVGQKQDMTEILPQEELDRINQDYNAQIANQLNAQPPVVAVAPDGTRQGPPSAPKGPEPQVMTDSATTSISTAPSMPTGPVEAKPVPIDPDVLAEVNPHVFWDPYIPQKQFRNRQVIYEEGFDKYKPYRDDIIQSADWSGDGGRVLMIYRPSVIHTGTWRTIPVMYEVATGHVTRYTILPKRIWHEFLRRYPELAKPENRLWDIRPMGWSAENPAEEIVVKLVVFEGQSELPGAFFTYNTADNVVRYLGSSISPELIAHNGWTVTFADPYDPRGPQTYAYGEVPEKRPPKPPKKSVGRRLRFWEKDPPIAAPEPHRTSF